MSEQRSRAEEGLRQADAMPAGATLAVDELPPVVGPHSRAKALLASPLDLADTVRVVHSSGLPGGPKGPSPPERPLMRPAGHRRGIIRLACGRTRGESDGRHGKEALGAKGAGTMERSEIGTKGRRAAESSEARSGLGQGGVGGKSAGGIKPSARLSTLVDRETAIVDRRAARLTTDWCR